MKSIFLSLLFCFIGCFIYANTITGVVVDAKSKKNIAFVRIGIENCSSTLSDSSGHFSIDLPSGDSYNDKNTIVIFDRPGYSTLSISLEDYRASGGIVSMNPIPAQRKDISISTSTKARKEGITKGSCTYIISLDQMKETGGEFGFILGNNLPCYVSSLNLYIGNTKIRYLQFRVNIYDVQNNNQRMNDYEIITKADLGNAYLAQDGWVKFDISNYNLIIDRKVLIVFENLFHPNIAKDIELSFPGLTAMIGQGNFYYRLSPFDNFEKTDLKVSIYAEVTPIL